MARAALRVMVVQRVRISSVLGLGGTLGALEAVSLPLELTDPELSVLVLEPRRLERLRSGLTLGWGEAAGLPVRLSRCSSSLKLEDDSLLEEKLVSVLALLESLVLLMLRARPSEVEASLSICVCDQVSERTSRDRALWRRPGTLGSPLD